MNNNSKFPAARLYSLNAYALHIYSTISFSTAFFRMSLDFQAWYTCVYIYLYIYYIYIYNIVGEMNMGNIVPRVGLKPTSLAFWDSVLPHFKHHENTRIDLTLV